MAAMALVAVPAVIDADHILTWLRDQTKPFGDTLGIAKKRFVQLVVRHRDVTERSGCRALAKAILQLQRLQTEAQQPVLIPSGEVRASRALEVLQLLRVPTPPADIWAATLNLLQPTNAALVPAAAAAPTPLHRLRLGDAAGYARLEPVARVQLLLMRDAMVRRLRSEAYNLQRKLDRVTAKMEKLAIADCEVPSAGAALAVWGGLEKVGRSLTPRGVLALGIRRNLGNIAAGDMSLALACDISRQAVCRCDGDAAFSWSHARARQRT